MENLFHLDSPVMRWLTWLGDIILLNLIFVVSALPVITAGAALSALYYVTGRRIRQEGHLWRDYWNAFRSNWKQATSVWMIILVLGALISLCLYFYFSANFAQVGIALFLLGLTILLWATSSAWCFVLIARFEGGLRQTIMNAFFCSILFLPQSIAAAVINLIPILILFFFTKTFLRLGIVWLFVWFAFAAWLVMLLLKQPLQKLEKKSASAT